MNVYRLRIDEIKGDAVVTSYTRWLEAVIVKGTDNQEVYVAFSPQFEHIWLESKKRLPQFVADQPANLGLRSRYSIRLYGWAKKDGSVGKKRISLEELRRVLGLESVQDVDGKIIKEPPLSLWANFQQRALDPAILGRNRWDQGLSAAEMRRCHWVKPVMVCQIRFTEWTRDDRLRQPVFLGIREDKIAMEVVREKAN
jgi:hypothetical protein